MSGGAGARRRHDVRQHDCRLSWSVARHAEVCARACGLARFQTVSHSFRLGAGACAKLRALEDRFPNPWHPVVRVHPDTGCRSLFVNPQFTVRLRGVKEDESVTMLNYLYRQAAVPENQLRVKWRPNTVVIWDNRSVQHYAVHDYYPQSRTMDRITIAGDAPVGVAGPYMPEAPFDHHPALTTGVRASARPARQFERG
ncbi:TauD/TfdA dioxygenase family protein [Rhodopila sp.]|uniref:TauD/TfdA dioxygenase family protein n=1 Tax=Rhodopila sp. TaxID=2480087 RepID=UPI003D0F9F8D